MFPWDSRISMKLLSDNENHYRVSWDLPEGAVRWKPWEIPVEMMMMMMVMLASSSTSLSPGHPNTHPAHLTAIQAHPFVLSEKKSSYRVVFPPFVHPPSLPCWENQFKPSWGGYLVSWPGQTGPFCWFCVGDHLKTTLGWLRLFFQWDFFYSGWCGVWVSDLY